MIDKIRSNAIAARYVQPITSASAGNGAAPTGRAVAQDQASLSTRARELSLAHAAARQAPEVRAERVAALREQIAAGSYHVPDALLADKLMGYKG